MGWEPTGGVRIKGAGKGKVNVIEVFHTHVRKKNNETHESHLRRGMRDKKE